jgi:hypothetical protein
VVDADATDEDLETGGVWLDRRDPRSNTDGRRSDSLSESGVFRFVEGWRSDDATFKILGLKSAT